MNISSINPNLVKASVFQQEQIKQSVPKNPLQNNNLPQDTVVISQEAEHKLQQLQSKPKDILEDGINLANQVNQPFQKAQNNFKKDDLVNMQIEGRVQYKLDEMKFYEEQGKTFVKVGLPSWADSANKNKGRRSSAYMENELE